MESIEITFDVNGEIKVQTKGFSGKSCVEGSKFVEEALGTKTGEKLTGEYYQTTQNQTLDRKIS
jgi:hypothetical protein